MRVLAKSVAAAALAAWLLFGIYGTAGAAVTSVSVASATDIGIYNHHPYREITLRMVGTAPGGAYDVPLKLAYPTDSGGHSGVAVVDVVNSVFQA